MSLLKKCFFATAILSASLNIFSTSAQAVVATNNNKNTYTGNSVARDWTYTFPIIAASDIQVYKVVAGVQTLISSAYTVNTNTNTVTYPTIASGLPLLDSSAQIILLRTEPLTQSTHLTNQGPFNAATLEQAYDKLTMITQQHDEQLKRAVLEPLTGSTSLILPPALAGDLIGWDTNGNLANISNPSLIAQWTPSGADISYNLGNVSTSNNLTANNLIASNNVGIGTTVPIQALDVRGSSALAINVKSSGGSTSLVADAPGASDSLVALRNNGVDSVVLKREASTTDFVLLTVNTERLRVSAGGNVGIGTALPGVKLDVQGTVRGTAFTTAGSYTQSGTSANTFTGTPTFSNATFSGLFTGGNVGINSTNPGQRLDVQGTVAATSFTGQSGHGILGSWTSCPTVNTSTLAATDLFVTVWQTCPSSPSHCGAWVLTDSSNPPTTTRNRNEYSNSGTIAYFDASGTSMVRKGDYYLWNVTTDGGGSATCSQVSIGS